MPVMNRIETSAKQSNVHRVDPEKGAGVSLLRLPATRALSPSDRRPVADYAAEVAST
jgi:hypothetical protein